MIKSSYHIIYLARKMSESSYITLQSFYFLRWKTVKNFKAWLHKHVQSPHSKLFPKTPGVTGLLFDQGSSFLCPWNHTFPLIHVSNMFSSCCFFPHCLKPYTHVHMLTRNLLWPLVKSMHSQDPWKATGCFLFQLLSAFSLPRPFQFNSQNKPRRYVLIFILFYNEEKKS